MLCVATVQTRRDCWYDGKLLNISERFMVDIIDLRINACYLSVLRGVRG
jgi:hypothetical protein